MKRLALIGDSHLAALRSGMNNPRFQEYLERTEFFQWRSTGVKAIVLQAGDSQESIPTLRLLERHSYLVNLDNYDAIVLVGLGISVRALLDIYRHHRHELQAQEESTTLVSEDCWNTACRGLMEQSLAMVAVEKLRRLTQLPIFVIPTPMASQHFLEERIGPNQYRTCLANGDDSGLLSSFLAAQSVWEAHDVTFVQQPTETTHRSILTQGQYCRANPSDTRPDSAFVQRDLTHMNSLFGESMLQAMSYSMSQSTRVKRAANS